MIVLAAMVVVAVMLFGGTEKQFPKEKFDQDAAVAAIAEAFPGESAAEVEERLDLVNAICTSPIDPNYGALLSPMETGPTRHWAMATLEVVCPTHLAQLRDN